MADPLPDAPRGTPAHKPDAGWSQARETVLMLELSALQIEAAMRDSNHSVESLMGSFTAMVEHIRTISDTVQRLPDLPETRGAKRELANITGEVSGLVNQAVVAFQFYDKLAQRLAHVGTGLDELSQLVGDGERLQQPAEWARLQETIRSRYTTPEEQTMFEAVMSGTPVRAALDSFLAGMSHKSDDIEFF